jgi:recombinational DNA repair ATPase RecF
VVVSCTRAQVVPHFLRICLGECCVRVLRVVQAADQPLVLLDEVLADAPQERLQLLLLLAQKGQIQVLQVETQEE